jgi:hypothetical protein
MLPLETKSEPPQPHHPSASDYHSDPRWPLVERILQSAPFQKSSNLHALLSYLAEYSMAGKAEALTERQVGIAVFGKPADYSPAEDSAVRVHVRQLRLRLHEYFALEGRHETQHVDIPKGSYALEFRSADPETSPRETPPPKPAVASNEPRIRSAWKVLFWITAAVAVVCAAGWYRAVKTTATPRVPWPLAAVIQSDRQTRVIVSDSSMMLRQLGERETTLDEYVQPDYRQSMIPPHLPENFARLVNYIADSQLTSFADLTTVSTLMKLAGPNSTQLVVTSARDLDRRDLERGNYVFVGGPTSNPWVDLFANRLNFMAVEEGVGGRMYFRNRNPMPGEQKEYEGLATTGSPGEDYATLSLLPSQSGPGNVMILQGLRQEGTEALSVLLANADDRAALEKALQSKSKSASPYFEALVRSHAVAGAPVSVDIVAVRTIEQ